jgi:FlaA1/EpsC-like NDP-sugar epimerase
MKKLFKNKRVMITGVCGTVGSELATQLTNDFDVMELVGLDNNESELFFLEQNLSKHGNTVFYLADVRDKAKLGRQMKDIDVVFHTAAYKHVILCERSPLEAVQTNILGVHNVVTAAIENGVEMMVFTSSDKAVNPTSVMGTSKLMGERLMTAANTNSKDMTSRFASTRFGNVLGSRGSVIPIFKEQIRRGGPVTLTDPEMTRFIMSIKQAVRLVIESAVLAKGGEVFITKMPVIRIKDLAEVMIEKLAPQSGHRVGDIDIEIMGTKPGEKMYEELMNQEETRRAFELERYFVVQPAFDDAGRDVEYYYPKVVNTKVHNPYNSANEKPLSREALSEFLEENNLLQVETEKALHPAERHWPDIVSKS